MEHIHNTLTSPSEKSKMDSLASSILKNIVTAAVWSRFLVKLIFCIAFGSASSACYLLKSVSAVL